VNIYAYIVYKLQLTKNLLNVIYIHASKHAVILTFLCNDS